MEYHSRWHARNDYSDLSDGTAQEGTGRAVAVRTIPVEGDDYVALVKHPLPVQA
jgi:hypothetical protein